MNRTEYIARVHEEDGSLWAEVLDLPGCFASGDSLDELRESLEEAVVLYLSDGSARQPLASSSARRMTVGEMRVTVPA
jgi:predicted RNase H-like HicB family nuclease